MVLTQNERADKGCDEMGDAWQPPVAMQDGDPI